MAGRNEKFQFPTVLLQDDCEFLPVVNEIGGRQPFRQILPQPLRADAAERGRVAGIQPEDGIFVQTLLQPPKRFRGNELWTSQPLEKIAGEDFPGQFHQPQGPVNVAPLEEGGFFSRYLAKKQAIAEQELAHPVLVQLMGFQRIESLIIFRRSEKGVAAGQGSRRLPAGQAGSTAATDSGVAYLNRGEIVFDTLTQQIVAIAGDAAPPQQLPKPGGQRRAVEAQSGSEGRKNCIAPFFQEKIC